MLSKIMISASSICSIVKDMVSSSIKPLHKPIKFQVKEGKIMSLCWTHPVRLMGTEDTEVQANLW